jgi:UDP-N-acetylglucosamine 2-epimerase (non-hydrolysing)
MRGTVFHIVGARPNFMKMAPLIDALAEEPGGYEHLLVHTGQHYDVNLNEAIFRDLGLRSPDIHLGVGSGSHAEQTSRVMIAFEKLVNERKPALVVVAGDVNSTLACSIVAAKANVPVAHLEAGLRSGDWTMPEEINRIVTDRLTQLHLTPSADADENLLREGMPAAGIARVGNCMIDSVLRHLARARDLPDFALPGLTPRGFVLATLHRPSNVDSPDHLLPLIRTLQAVGQKVPVVFPVHPRTRARLQGLAITPGELDGSRVHLCDPLGYLEFLKLQDAALVVLTDSGGVQEETTVLGIPCLTVRDNTERPITVSEGTNKLIGSDPAPILGEVEEVLAGRGKQGRAPELWDGRAGPRAAEAVRRFLAMRTS